MHGRARSGSNAANPERPRPGLRLPHPASRVISNLPFSLGANPYGNSRDSLRRPAYHKNPGFRHGDIIQGVKHSGVTAGCGFGRGVGGRIDLMPPFSRVFHGAGKHQPAKMMAADRQQKVQGRNQIILKCRKNSTYRSRPADMTGEEENHVRLSLPDQSVYFLATPKIYFPPAIRIPQRRIRRTSTPRTVHRCAGCPKRTHQECANKTRGARNQRCFPIDSFRDFSHESVPAANSDRGKRSPTLPRTAMPSYQLTYHVTSDRINLQRLQSSRV